MVFPLLERHVATTIAVARFLEYSGKSRARCASRYESCRHLETSTLPYMVVLGQVFVQRVLSEELLCEGEALSPDSILSRQEPASTPPLTIVGRYTLAVRQ